jgi:branched-chain amino acid aminotransferase
MRTAYLNHSWVPESELRISAFDLSVMQGAAAFEMTRSFKQQHFKLDEHILRLRDSMRLLGIADPLPAKFAWHDMVGELTLRNPMSEDEEHRLLLVASPGCAPMYHNIEGTVTHSFAYAATFPLRFTVAGMTPYFTEGVPLVISTVRQVPSLSIPARAKHRSRLAFHLAQQKAAPDWPLILTYDDQIAEVSGANVCCLMDDEHLICSNYEALPGISQQFVADLAMEDGFHVRWDKLDMGDIFNAEEIWLTATPWCILPVSRVEGRPVGSGSHECYYRILDKWSERVGVDVQSQIVGWDAVRTVTN